MKFLSLEGLTTLVEKIKTLITTSISTKADKLETAVSGQVLIDDGNGNLSGSGKLVGGSTLAEVPDGNTLATEVAIATALAEHTASVVAISDEEIDNLFTS